MMRASPTFVLTGQLPLLPAACDRGTGASAVINDLSRIRRILRGHGHDKRLEAGAAIGSALLRLDRRWGRLRPHASMAMKATVELLEVRRTELRTALGLFSCIPAGDWPRLRDAALDALDALQAHIDQVASSRRR